MQYVVYKWDTGDYIGYQKTGEFETAHEAIEFVNKQHKGFPYHIMRGGVLYKKISKRRYNVGCHYCGKKAVHKHTETNKLICDDVDCYINLLFDTRVKILSPVQTEEIK
jgi:hypothetical protein